MKTKTTHNFAEPNPQKSARHICPQCNSDMLAAEQHRENGTLFTWYECTANNCDEQWLEKKTETKQYA